MVTTHTASNTLCLIQLYNFNWNITSGDAFMSLLVAVQLRVIAFCRYDFDLGFAAWHGKARQDNHSYIRLHMLIMYLGTSVHAVHAVHAVSPQ